MGALNARGGSWGGVGPKARKPESMLPTAREIATFVFLKMRARTTAMKAIKVIVESINGIVPALGYASF